MPESDLILLALDDMQILQLFERVMAAALYKTAVARDRVSLDKAMQETTPALLIISEEFSGVSGLETATILLERFPTLPVLLFGAHDTRELIRQAIKIGVCDCLFPPLRLEDITQSVENALKRARAIGDWTRREVKKTTASLEQRVTQLQRLETIMDHIEDGVIILDGQDHLLMINPAIRRAFDIQQEDIYGKPVMEVIPHPDLRPLLQPGYTNPIKYHEIAMEDGRVFNAQVGAVPGIGLAVTLQDISYLKQIDRLKSEFVSTVSHDLRSPLTAILGYLELLDRVGPVNEQQKDFIRKVHTSVQSITALINDLLELGRIEAGISVDKETVSLGSVLQATIENLNTQIIEKKINLQVDVPEQLPQISGNPVRIRQLMDNLLGNAVKYTPEGGDVSASISIEADQLIFKVSDTGPGIPPIDQPYIFDKFYRASNVPAKVKGSGLGLAIVKSIVDNHHGRIWVDSSVGSGSTFVVVMPFVKPTAA